MCVVLGAALPAAAQPAVRFRYEKALDRGAAPDEEIVAFTLDSDTYDATRSNFPDLRVLDRARAEVPYQLEADVEFREERTRQSFATEVVSLREGDNAIEVHLRIGKRAPYADGFRLVTAQADYERKVQVFGSDDGVEWKPLLADGIIFDYSRYMDVSNRELKLPANTFREFKLHIGDVTDEKESPYKELARTFRGGKEEERTERTMIQRRTFRIERIEALHTVTEQRVRRAKTSSYPIVRFEAQEDSANKQTIISIDTRREPLTSFTLVTPSRNFSRRVVVEVPIVKGVQTDWQQIGAGTVSHFGFRSYRHEQLRVEFPERRDERYRIVIHNEDNPPLEIAGVAAEGNVYRVVFLALKAEDYRVLYGSELATSPKYEAGVVLAALRNEDFQPVAAKLGPQVENPEFGGEPDLALRALFNNWYFLGGVICLMVVALGWSLFRAGRHLKDLPPDEAGS